MKGNKRSIWKSLLLILLTSSILVSTVFATPTEDELEAEKEAAQQELKELKDDMENLMYNINLVEQELVSLGQQIIQAEQELVVAEQKRAEQYETMKARIVVMYENDNDTMLSMLFESGSMVDLLKRAEFIQSVHDYDRNALDEYVKNIEKIETLKTSLEEDLAVVEEKQDEYEKDKYDLESMIGRLEGKIDDLDEQIEEAARKAAEEAAKKAEEEALRQQQQQQQSNSVYVPPSGTGGGSAIVDAAYAYLGVPYVWGGSGFGGIDCSGLVLQAHKAIGVSLYHYSGSIGRGGASVSASDRQPGDVVCYVGHVGIYVGNGYMIHAPQTGDVVKVVKVYGSPWYRRYW